MTTDRGAAGRGRALFVAALAIAACAGPAPAIAPAIAAPFRYETTTLIPNRYAGEETGEVWGTKVAYLGPAGRASYVLAVRDGLLFGADGQLFTSTDKHGAIFVMDVDGTFYASNQREPGEFHHSSFFAGGPIAAGGELVVEAGVLKRVTDVSGHYEPDHRFTVQALCELSRRGVVLAGVRLELVTAGAYDAGEYLAGKNCPR